MDKQLTVCFTGHRQIGEATAAVEARVTELAEGLIQQGYLCFCAGGARGFDTLASRVSVVRMIFDEYINGSGYHAIVGRLNRLGIPRLPTKVSQGRPFTDWSIQQIKRIITGCILFVGRILGESAALLFTAGAAHKLFGLLDGLTNQGATLTVALYFYAKESREFDVAFAIAAILMLLTLAINLSAALVGWIFRPCLKNVKTPKRRIFFRHSALIFLAIHKVWRRQIALIGEKISRRWAFCHLSNKA